MKIYSPSNFVIAMSVDSSTIKLNLASPISARKSSQKCGARTFFIMFTHFVRRNLRSAVSGLAQNLRTHNCDKWSTCEVAVCSATKRHNATSCSMVLGTGSTSKEILFLCPKLLPLETCFAVVACFCK